MMALNAPADPVSGEPPPAGPTQPGRVLDKLWIAASSPQLTIALAVSLAFTFATAALLPQLPAGSDALAAGRWLSTTAARYARFGPFLSSSGLFNVLAGPWIITLLASIAFHLALRTVNQARRLAGTWAAAPASSALLPGAPQGLPFELVHLPLSVDAVQAKMEAQVVGSKRALLTTAASSAPGRGSMGTWSVRSWAAAGPLLTYLGPLLLVLGLLWNTLGGWRATDVTLIPGRTVQPAQAGGLALSLVDAGSCPLGDPQSSRLTRGSQTRHAWLGYARPATWGPVWVAQRSSGPALAVKASFGGRCPAATVVTGRGRAGRVTTPAVRTERERASLQHPGTQPGLSGRQLREPGRSRDRPSGLPGGRLPGNRPNARPQRTGGGEWNAGVAGGDPDIAARSLRGGRLSGDAGFALAPAGWARCCSRGVAITAWGGLTRTWLNAAAERDGTLLAVRVAAPAVGQAEVAAVGARIDLRLGRACPAILGRANSCRTRCDTLVYMLGGAVLLLALGALALRGMAAPTPQSRTWSLFLHAGLGVPRPWRLRCGRRAIALVCSSAPIIRRRCSILRFRPRHTACVGDRGTRAAGSAWRLSRC